MEDKYFVVVPNEPADDDYYRIDSGYLVKAPNLAVAWDRWFIYLEEENLLDPDDPMERLKYRSHYEMVEKDLIS